MSYFIYQLVPIHSNNIYLKFLWLYINYNFLILILILIISND